MAPLPLTSTRTLITKEGEFDLDFVKEAAQDEVKPHPGKYHTIGILYHTYYHILACVGFYHLFYLKWQSLLWVIFYHYCGIIGIGTGVHRLYSHRAFKATVPLRILLLFMYAIANGISAFSWSRDHRVHHKYSDTDADPHNAKRGLFYSHFGWLLLHKHPEVINKGKNINLDDLYNDPILMFHHRHYTLIRFITCIVIPIFVPTYFWGEYWLYAWTAGHGLVQVFTSHCSYTVNSLSHQFGMKPYDTSYLASECRLSNGLTLGEGHHNYHHAFPYDYSHGEFNSFLLPFNLFRLPNGSTTFIETCALLGLAYDLRRPPKEMVLRRMNRTGDGSLKVE